MIADCFGIVPCIAEQILNWTAKGEKALELCLGLAWPDWSLLLSRALVGNSGSLLVVLAGSVAHRPSSRRHGSSAAADNRDSRPGMVGVLPLSGMTAVQSNAADQLWTMRKDRSHYQSRRNLTLDWKEDGDDWSDH